MKNPTPDIAEPASAAMNADAIAKASRVNYLQVNVVFDPLSAEQRQQRPGQP